MKKAIIAIMWLLLGATTPVWADFEAGQDAFYRGDYAKAFSEWRPLAEKGHPEAQLNLAYIYTRGLGVPQDYVEAVKWYRRAAEQGLAEAQDALGTMYFRGYGIRQNYTEAVKWYRKAAAQNLASAFFNLASMYANGLGVRQDLQTAFGLALKASNMDDIGGQFLVAQLYETGRGVKQDNVQALMWYGLVASKANLPFPEFQSLGSKALAASRALMTRMTEEEILRASKLIREWKPTMTGRGGFPNLPRN